MDKTAYDRSYFDVYLFLSFKIMYPYDSGGRQYVWVEQIITTSTVQTTLISDFKESREKVIPKKDRILYNTTESSLCRVQLSYHITFNEKVIF